MAQNIKIPTINVQSVRSKDHFLREHTDIVLMCECWLTNDDIHWINKYELNTDVEIFLSAQRIHRRRVTLRCVLKSVKLDAHIWTNLRNIWQNVDMEKSRTLVTRQDKNGLQVSSDIGDLD